MASRRSCGQPLITPRLCRSRYQISMVARRSITKRYFDRGQEKEIIDFLQFGFFASSSLDKFRKIADEREMSILSAYILEEQKKKAPKTTTKFTI